jgi:hypothetical protein
MATSTTRLSLRKPDTTDLVNVGLDLGANYDLLDNAVGALPATSGTRPSTPFNGQTIRETDTGKVYVSNGSAPASASWNQLYAAGADFSSTGNFTLSGTGSNLTVGGSASVAGNLSLPTTGGSSKLLLGPDVNLYRSAANVLATDDSLTVGGNLTVTGRITGVSNLSGEATAGNTLSTSYADVPGAFVTFTTTKAGTVVMAQVAADVSWGSGLANSDTISVIVSVDGTDITTGGAVVNAPGSAFVGAGLEASAPLAPIILAAAGTHTIQLRARRTNSATGTAATNSKGTRGTNIGGCRVVATVYDL